MLLKKKIRSYVPLIFLNIPIKNVRGINIFHFLNSFIDIYRKKQKIKISNVFKLLKKIQTLIKLHHESDIIT